MAFQTIYTNMLPVCPNWTIGTAGETNTLLLTNHRYGRIYDITNPSHNSCPNQFVLLHSYMLWQYRFSQLTFRFSHQLFSILNKINSSNIFSYKLRKYVSESNNKHKSEDKNQLCDSNKNRFIDLKLIDRFFGHTIPKLAEKIVFLIQIMYNINWKTNNLSKRHLFENARLIDWMECRNVLQLLKVVNTNVITNVKRLFWL